MNTPKHTPAPWLFDANGDIISAQGPIAWLPDQVGRPKKNAARIVACVNACEGVDSAALLELPGGLAGMLDLAQKVTLQRNALYAAMRGVVRSLDSNDVIDALELALDALEVTK